MLIQSEFYEDIESFIESVNKIIQKLDQKEYIKINKNSSSNLDKCNLIIRITKIVLQIYEKLINSENIEFHNLPLEQKTDC